MAGNYWVQRRGNVFRKNASFKTSQKRFGKKCIKITPYIPRYKKLHVMFLEAAKKRLYSLRLRVKFEYMEIISERM